MRASLRRSPDGACIELFAGNAGFWGTTLYFVLDGREPRTALVAGSTFSDVNFGRAYLEVRGGQVEVSTGAVEGRHPSEEAGNCLEFDLEVRAIGSADTVEHGQVSRIRGEILLEESSGPLRTPPTEAALLG